MAVRVLSDQVINQISAGEVVDRPASVVRELLDNSIDAGASDITVYLEAGGRSLIRVSDDGSGMNRDDALLAFQRHATSKISNAEELLEISTLGFRGEALPSIAAVSRVQLLTNCDGGGAGTEIVIEGGVLRAVNARACTKGSDFQARNLFFNTPARRKFLKEAKNEEQKVKQLILQRSVVHPQVRFRLYCDDKEVLNLPRRATVLERGKSIVRGSCVNVEYQQDGISVTGLVAHPSQAQADTSAFLLFINKRLVQDRMLLKAVKEGFDSTLKDREFPMGYIEIAMPAALVDVNVHPQKSEVRFRRAQDMFLIVRQAVLNAVRSFQQPMPLLAKVEQISAPRVTHQATSAFFNTASQTAVNSGLFEPAPSYPSFQRKMEYASVQHEPEETFRFSELQFLSQIFSCYLLCTLGDNFYVVDMHAAHERVNYNIMRARFHNSAEQVLLVPIIVELSSEGASRVNDAAGLFKSYGFTIELFSETAIAVRSMPSLIHQAEVPQLIKEVAIFEESQMAAGRFEEALDRRVARLACHASIRSGYIMSQEEVRALFGSMDNAELSAACPHGRPVVVKFHKDEIEKWFGRDR